MVVEALRRNRAAVGAVQFTHPFRQKGEVENRIGEPPLPVDTLVRGRISLTYQNWAQLTLDRWGLEIVIF